MRLRALLGSQWHGAVACGAHIPDLDALRRFLSDGRPFGHEAVLAAISAGACPACQPSYMAADDRWRPAVSSRRPTGGVSCRCCGTVWDLTGGSWSGHAGHGLHVTGAASRLPRGYLLEPEKVVVVPFDPWDLGPILLRHFSSAKEAAGSEGFLADLSEAVAAAVTDRADLEAELERVGHEHGLSREDLEAWRGCAGEAASVARRATFGGRPSREESCGRCGDQAVGVQVSEERFAELVSEGLALIPPEIAEHVVNVAIVIEESHPDHLLGLFQGVALTRQHFAHPVQSRIVLFRETLSRHSDSEGELAEAVAATVVHEVGHYFGLDDPELRRLGW